MRYESFSAKQAEIFKFMAEPYDALICDGAVRSGKTTVMIIAYIEWAMACFDLCNFAICGKTVRSAERNIIAPLMQIASLRKKYKLSYTRTTSMLEISRAGRTNYFYVFGGRDESSYMLIQGITLSGVLFDEVALMPQSFVDQAIARQLSVDNAKLWFNCNPANATHWFYKEWVQKADNHNAKHLHFLMSDNPSLSAKALEKAEQSFTGVFYDRYVLGLWVAAEGLIYDMFDVKKHVVKTEKRKYSEYILALDYGTLNATAALLLGYFNGVWYAVDEYYYSGRDAQKQKTDEEYYKDINAFIGDIPVRTIIVDPSAASFIATIRRHNKYIVLQASNGVLDGIRFTASLIKSGKILINDACKNLIEELQEYHWDETSEDDRPIKEKDHACDALRYAMYTHVRRNAYKYGLHTIGSDED